MGFFSEDGNKSMMRFIVFIIAICGCIIVMGSFIMWVICIFHSLIQTVSTSDRVDISQPAQLGCWLIGLALTGKTLQKSVEFIKKNPNKHIQIETIEQKKVG